MQNANVALNTNTFGLVVPGRALLFEWRQIEAEKLAMAIPRPQEISDLCFFLLPSASLPLGSGAALHFSFDGSSWTMLGFISQNRPSVLMRTNWEVVAAGDHVQLGVSLEPLEVLENLEQSNCLQQERGRMDWAFHLAKDLYNFVMSFAQTTQVGDRIMLPLDAMDTWMTRFKAKYKRNPNFVFASQS